MASNAALQYLNVNPGVKDPIEVYFSLQMLTTILGTIPMDKDQEANGVTVMSLLASLANGVQKEDVYLILKALGYDADE